jgi:hypothetical protein
MTIVSIKTAYIRRCIDNEIRIGCNIRQLPNLSRFHFPTKAARAAGYLPNERHE